MSNPCFSIVYGNYLIGLQKNKKYRIDFVNHNECVFTQGSWINIPGVATKNVYIRCDGEAPIIYSTNASNIDNIMGGYIIKGKERDLKFEKTNLKSVNIFVVDDGTNSLTNVAIDTIV